MEGKNGITVELVTVADLLKEAADVVTPSAAFFRPIYRFLSRDWLRHADRSRNWSPAISGKSFEVAECPQSYR